MILTQLLKQRLDPKAFSNILAAASRSATAAPAVPPLPESGQAATEAPPGDTSSHRPLYWNVRCKIDVKFLV